MTSPLRRLTITLDAEGRKLAHSLIEAKPDGWQVAIMPPSRTTAQNKTMWALLTDLSKQVLWHGEWLTPDDWKDVMTASLRKSRVVPTIEHDGLVALGLHTSEMEAEEFSALLEIIHYFGAREGVQWSAPKWVNEWAKEARR